MHLKYEEIGGKMITSFRDRLRSVVPLKPKTLYLQLNLERRK